MMFFGHFWETTLCADILMGMINKHTIMGTRVSNLELSICQNELGTEYYITCGSAVYQLYV